MFIDSICFLYVKISKKINYNYIAKTQKKVGNLQVNFDNMLFNFVILFSNYEIMFISIIFLSLKLIN